MSRQRCDISRLILRLVINAVFAIQKELTSARKVGRPHKPYD